MTSGREERERGECERKEGWKRKGDQEKMSWADVKSSLSTILSPFSPPAFAQQLWQCHTYSHYTHIVCIHSSDVKVNSSRDEDVDRCARPRARQPVYRSLTAA